jgi:hypothetical protein
MAGYRNTSPPSMERWNHRRENSREPSKREGIYVRREPRREPRREGGRDRSREAERSRERETRGKREKERERESHRMPKKEGVNGMEVIQERKEVGKESKVESSPPREIRKGLPPPAALLHGYKQPHGKPKAILKKAEGLNPPGQVNGPPISRPGLKFRRQIVRQTCPPTCRSQ